MPEYDATHMPSSPQERYAGPPPAREYETSGLGAHISAKAVPAVPPPPDAPAPLESVSPPPGHTAQP